MSVVLNMIKFSLAYRNKHIITKYTVLLALEIPMTKTNCSSMCMITDRTREGMAKGQGMSIIVNQSLPHIL